MGLTENLTLKDLLRYPRQAIFYLCICAVGYLADRLIPDEKDRQIMYLKHELSLCQKHSDETTSAYIASLKEKNTIIETQTHALKAIDSCLVNTYHKALKRK